MSLKCTISSSVSADMLVLVLVWVFLSVWSPSAVLLSKSKLCIFCFRYHQAMLRNAALQYAEDRYSKNRSLYVEQDSILKKMSTLGHVEGYTDSHDEEDLEMVRGMGDGSCDEGTDQTGQPKKQDSVVPSRATSARVSFKTAGSEDDDMLDKEKTWLETAQEQVLNSITVRMGSI